MKDFGELNQTLKLCPDPECMWTASIKTTEAGRFYVGCDDCNARTFNALSPKEAAEWWNFRVYVSKESA